MTRVRVQSDPFDVGAELAGFGAGDDVGAVVSFTGVVRGTGGLTRMEIEHYPGMTETAIARYAEEARTRWDLADVLVIHRHGGCPGKPVRGGRRPFGFAVEVVAEDVAVKKLQFTAWNGMVVAVCLHIGLRPRVKISRRIDRVE